MHHNKNNREHHFSLLFFAYFFESAGDSIAAPQQKTAKGSRPMPKPAIYTVLKTFYVVILAFSDESCHHSKHLILTDAPFQFELIIAYTGKGLPYLYNPMQNKLAVVTAVQGQIVLLQFLRQRR